MNPKLYTSVASTILGIFAVYGVIGNIFNVRELTKFPDKGDWPFNQHYTVYLMLSINSFYIVAGLFGLLAIINQKMYLYCWSAFILLGSFAVQLLHGVACIRASLELDISKEIFSTFKKYTDDSHFTTWLYDFQWQYDCCGIKSYIDWSGPLTSQILNGNYSVPDSCCNRKERVPLPSCGHGFLAPNMSVDSAKTIINIDGCGSKISQFYQNEIRTKGCVMLMAAFIALVSGLVLFACQKDIGELKCCEGQNRTVRQRTTTGRVQRTPRERANHVSRANSRLDMNANVPNITTVAHKPPTGRGLRGGKCTKQDSARNVAVNNQWAQKTCVKHQRLCQSQKYGSIIQRRYPGKVGSRNNNDFMRTKLEMLMHPIETHSTSSATPNPSDLFPFYGHQTSSSDCFHPIPSTFESGSASHVDPKIGHYNSLPLFTSSYGNVVTFPDGRIETLYHYNTSHLHAQNTMRRKHSQRQKSKSNFVEGKYPSLTIASTLATIHEENESVKSGNSSTASASSSPRSTSKTVSNHNQTLENDKSQFPDLSTVIETGSVFQQVSRIEENLNNSTDSNTNLPELKSTKNFGRRLGKIPSRCIDPALAVSRKCIGVTRKGSTFVTTQE